MRIVPSGILSIRATIPATPRHTSWSGRAARPLGPRGYQPSIRSPESTSFTSLIDRSCPTPNRESVSGNGDHLPERQHRQRSGSGCVLTLPNRRRGHPGLDDLDRRPSVARRPPAIDFFLVSDRDPPAGPAAGARRQLDRSNAVFVRGPGLLGDDVGVQLHDAAEGTRLDLDLLVDPALRLPHRALAADHELSPDDLEADVSRLTPASSALTTARGGSPQ